MEEVCGWDRNFCELVHSFTKLLWTLWASDIHEMCLTLQAFFFLLAFIDTALTCIPWHMKSHVQSTLRISFSRSCWTQRWTRIVSAPCGLWILHQVQPFWSTSPNWNIQMMFQTPYHVQFNEDGEVELEKCAPGASGDNVFYLRRLHTSHPSIQGFAGSWLCVRFVTVCSLFS